MRRSYFLAGLACAFVWSCLSSVAVCQQAAARPGASIALIDINYIFKYHAKFKDQMEGMKASVEQADQQMKAERDAIAKLGERLQEYNRGSANYKQLEEELAKRQADLTVKVSLQKNEFLQREARIYHDVYQEILQATDYYAKQNGYDIVLRFNGDPVDVERPDSVLSFINKPVVWYQKQLDITPAVLADLNRGAAPRANGAQPAPTATRPSVPFQQR